MHKTEYKAQIFVCVCVYNPAYRMNEMPQLIFSNDSQAIQWENSFWQITLEVLNVHMEKKK